MKLRGPSARVMRAFHSDALRLSQEARDWVGRFESQPSLAAEEVQKFYGVLHTWKGTASMVEGAEDIVRALTRIEALLARQPLVETARQPHWVPEARQAVERAHASLLDMQGLKTGELTSDSQAEAPFSRRTLLARAHLDGREALVYFPVTALIQILPPEDLRGRDSVYLRGAWVPVLGLTQAPGAVQFGVGFRTAPGSCVLAVSEILGFVTREQADQARALSAVSLPLTRSAA